MSIRAEIVHLSTNVDIETGDVSHLMTLRVEGLGPIQALVTEQVAAAVMRVVTGVPAEEDPPAELEEDISSPPPAAQQFQTMPDPEDDWDPEDGPKRGYNPPTRTVPTDRAGNPMVEPAVRPAAAHPLFSDEDGIAPA